jgi:hypothetical protein
LRSSLNDEGLLVRFQDLTAVAMKSTAFCDDTLQSCGDLPTFGMNIAHASSGLKNHSKKSYYKILNASRSLAINLLVKPGTYTHHILPK